MLSHKEILDTEYKNISFIRGYRHVEKYNDKVRVFFENGKVEVTYFQGDIIKIFVGEIHEESKNTRAIADELVEIDVNFVEEEKKIIILGNTIDTVINKESLKISFISKDGKIISEDYNPAGKSDKKIFISKINDAVAYYGFGEKGGSLDKKGCYLENFNTDDAATDDESFLFYKTIPFFIGLKEKSAYGIYFDNSFRNYFDMGKSMKDRIFFGADGGQLQYYFMASKDIKGVVKKYAELTGKMEMPPMWSLGYQQCRYSYYSEKEVIELAETFRKKDIPCDTIYLDIDYMDGYRVMTFNPDTFSEPKKMTRELERRGFKLVTIVDPGVKVDEEYEVFNRGVEGDYFVKKKDGNLYTGEVWPGQSAFPDFSNAEAREWWKKELKEFLLNGVRGIWNDMNEPATFDSEPRTLPEDCLHNADEGVMEHAEFHNLYGMEMSRCSMEAQEELHPNQRQFSMTRATFAGGQRYSSVWTGDNRSRWDQLRMSIPMNCNLGMSGISFVGNDVGGFGEDTTEELLIRWMQLGTFLPIFRNHSAVNTKRQEPWSLGARAEEISRKAIKLRYKLMPYLYNEYYKSYKEGLPVFRAMVMEFPEDVNVRDMYSQFMFGENMLVAPVLYEGERQKSIYLPKGTWYNYFTKEKCAGGRYYTVEVPLEEIAVFVKEGAIIPVYEEEYSYIGEKELAITLEVFKGTGKVSLYEDDGISQNYKSGKYNIYEIESTNNNTQNVKITLSHKGLDKVQDFVIRYM